MQILLQQEKLLSDIVVEAMRPFRQIKSVFTDGRDGRCIMGGIMSWLGWDGRVEPNIWEGSYVETAKDLLDKHGLTWNDMTLRNNRGDTIEEIADWLRANGH